MARIRLSDEDRERIGCDEWIEADTSRLSVSEAEQLEVAGGSYLDFLGSGAKAAQARVWVALMRIGLAPAKVSDLELNLAQLGAERSPGKAPSASAAAATSSTSARSGRRTRSKTS